MYCNKCGAEVLPDAAFCNKCGAEIVYLEENKGALNPLNPDVSTAAMQPPVQQPVFTPQPSALPVAQAVSVTNQPTAGETAADFAPESEEAQAQKKHHSVATIIGNVLWVILGGLFSAIGWLVIGVLWCITIIGIPIGKQCFKFAKLTFLPFGKQIVYGGSGGSVILNILWIIFTGFWSAVAYALVGVVFCITIIGIPFGKQYFKLARLMLTPFGAEIVG